MNILPPDPAFPIPNHHQTVRGESHVTGPSRASDGRRNSYDTAYRPSLTDTDYEHSHAWPPRKVTHHIQNHFVEDVGNEQQGSDVGDDGYGYGQGGQRRVSFVKPGNGVIEGVGLGTVHAVKDRRGSVQFVGVVKDGEVREKQKEKEREKEKEMKIEMEREIIKTVKKEREKEKEEEREKIRKKREVGVQVPEEGDVDNRDDQKRREEKADEEEIEVSIPTVAVTQIRKPYIWKEKCGRLKNLRKYIP